MRSQKRLQLSPTELTVLINLLVHWWWEGDWPCPSLSAISHRMGISRRTAERAVVSLEKKGLLHRGKGEIRKGGPIVTRFDLSGLVATLSDLAQQRAAT